MLPKMLISCTNLLIASCALYALMTLPVFGTTIVSVSGPADGGIELGEDASQTLAVGWTSSSVSYDLVTITATFSSVVGSGPSITAYLTTQIGPSATATSEVAPPTTFTPGAGPETDTLFSGLALENGTYFLVLTSSSAPGLQSWDFTNSPNVTTDTGVTLGQQGVANNLGSGSPNTLFPPASTFETVSNNLLFDVTGTPVPRSMPIAVPIAVPEPSSWLLAALGFWGLAGRLSRLGGTSLSRQ